MKENALPFISTATSALRPRPPQRAGSANTCYLLFDFFYAEFFDLRFT